MNPTCVKRRPCTYTPPAGQDIAPYLARLHSIIDQLNTTKDKNMANERLLLLIEDVTQVINTPIATPAARPRSPSHTHS